MPEEPPGGVTSEDREDFYEVYSEYAQMLRTWFVAYGVGGPLLFLTQPQIAEKIAASGRARPIVYLFLGGVVAQVLVAFINKWSAWYIYDAAGDAGRQRTWTYRAAESVSTQFWIDTACDLVAIAAFAVATLETLLIFT